MNSVHSVNGNNKTTVRVMNNNKGTVRAMNNSNCDGKLNQGVHRQESHGPPLRAAESFEPFVALALVALHIHTSDVEPKVA